jgi:deazaflavin-dependent oxidoreductase (nitroreductase family)
MPNLPRTAAAVAGTALGALLAYPPSRKQVVRAATVTFDEIMLRTQSRWTKNLVVLTTEGQRSGLPRTSVLSAVRMNGQLFLVPWGGKAGWLANVRRRPDVVLDDRRQVRRARAEVVEGKEAEKVRRAFLRRNVPPALHGVLARRGGPLGDGLPVVRLLIDGGPGA